MLPESSNTADLQIESFQALCTCSQVYFGSQRELAGTHARHTEVQISTSLLTDSYLTAEKKLLNSMRLGFLSLKQSIMWTVLAV